MLDPTEKYLFDDMVSQLRADDPEFVRDIDRLAHPRRRLRVTMAVVLWTLTPMCIVYGGWTGLLIAVIAAVYGAHLMAKRSGLDDETGRSSWWSASRRYPGAAL